MLRKTKQFAALIVGAINKSQQDTNESRDQANYVNALAACERGNSLRIVVFRNTETAIKENEDNPEVADYYQANLDILLRTPHINPATGRVNCVEAVPQP